MQTNIIQKVVHLDSTNIHTKSKEIQEELKKITKKDRLSIIFVNQDQCIGIIDGLNVDDEELLVMIGVTIPLDAIDKELQIAYRCY